MQAAVFAIFLSISSPYTTPDFQFPMDQIMYIDHGPVTEPAETEENIVKDATGVVHGEEIHFDIERIPFRDRGGHELWLRRGKPAEAFLDMVSYAAAHGYEIRLNSAYRTYDHQMRLWKRMPDLAGEPGKGGHRTHQTGCSIDIDGTIRVIDGVEHKTILFWWLNRFAKKFGFVNDVPSEPWHWTYMGPLDEQMEVGGD